MNKTIGTWRWRAAAMAAMAGAALLLGGCALEFGNSKPARAVARWLQPTGSVYSGWRVYQSRCASCHGTAATGTELGPDLMPLMRAMGPRRFVGLVLQRYDWARPAGQSPEHWIDQAVQRREPPVAMPAWQEEPAVNAHIMDLYAYLSARADGRQSGDRPTP